MLTDEYGNPMIFEHRGLNENQLYDFWVSASTAVGEGEPTPMVQQTTSSRGKRVYYFVSFLLLNLINLIFY